MSNTPPSANPLRWSTDTNFAAGAYPWSSGPTKVAPSLGISAGGCVPGQQLPAQHFNYLQSNHGDWLTYLRDAHFAKQATNWPERASFANTSTVNSNLPLAWDPTQGVNGNTGIYMCVTQDTKSVTSDDGTLWGNAVSFGGVLGAAAFDLAAGLSGASGGVRSFLASQSGAGNLMRTIDAGTTWTLVASGLPASSVLCNGPGSVWVACGTFGAIQRSTDGITWSNAGVTVTGGWGIGPKRIVWNGSLFVMLAGSALDKVLTSPDGLTWTARTLPTTQTWTGLAYSASEALWMAVSDGGAVVTSLDGLTWTLAVSVAAATAKDLAVIDSTWVAPTRNGDYGGIAYSIDRGASWRNASVGNQRVATSGWNRIIAADRRFLVAHASGTALEFALSQRAN